MFVASENRLCALAAEDGKLEWEFFADGTLTRPRRITKVRSFSDARDGRVYCLKADSGQLVWRFLAAPFDERIVTFGRLESLWPARGSVVVAQGRLYASAGVRELSGRRHHALLGWTR